MRSELKCSFTGQVTTCIFVELFFQIRGDVVPKTAENFKTLCVGSSEDKNMCYKWSKNNSTLQTIGRILKILVYYSHIGFHIAKLLLITECYMMHFLIIKSFAKCEPVSLNMFKVNNYYRSNNLLRRNLMQNEEFGY